MTKSYEFNWQKHVPEFMQEGAFFDRFDEVKMTHFSDVYEVPTIRNELMKIYHALTVKINRLITRLCQIHD